MYDAIVIGARCAGSPTAMLLARQGYRVLLVDRASFPSDTMSTHYIHQPGVAQLKHWGLLGRVIASNCPPMKPSQNPLFKADTYLSPVAERGILGLVPRNQPFFLGHNRLIGCPSG